QQIITNHKTAPHKIESRTNNNNTTTRSNTMSGVNSQWLSAFQEIQKNLLESQKSFQDTLAESHRMFLETSQTALQQLGNLSGNASFPNAAPPNLQAVARPQAVSQPQAVLTPEKESQPQPDVERVVEKLQLTQA